MTTSRVPLILPSYPRAFEYLPESDGQPMAETDIHRKQMMGLLECLEEYFRPDPDVYVTGNIFLYFLNDAGERQPVSPDIFVVRGIEKKDRRIYNMEVEKKAPALVIELTSLNTKVEDLGNKKVIYANLGVREYYIFDPLREALPRLYGYRLEAGEYLPMAGARLHSDVLGLDLMVEEGRLRLYHPQTGERLRIHEEAETARRVAEAQAAEAEAARQAAEAARQAAEAARQAAEAKAAEEAEARRRVETELAQLREELARLQPKAD